MAKKKDVFDPSSEPVQMKFNEAEKSLIVKGLDRIISDVEKVSISADRMNIKKAAKEVQIFKHEVETLRNKVLGKVPLL
ncbi:MAG: hypothetical protein WA082_04305 [Candidatus Moraniibacteriota bacterium]